MFKVEGQLGTFQTVKIEYYKRSKTMATIINGKELAAKVRL